MKTIKQIFEEIANESSTNQKMVILSNYKDNETLKRVLYLANSKRIKFYLKQIPEYKTEPMFRALDLALDQLEVLSSRQKTGYKAIDHLVDILSHLTEEDAYIIEKIVEKDCRINMGAENINKVFPKLLEKTPYQGAKSFDQKLIKKLFDGGKQVFSQIKKDGRYLNSIIRAGDVELESRGGEPSILNGAKFLDELSKFKDCVLNGELTMGNGISRYESNGIIASLISIGKKKLDGEDASKEIKKFEEKHMEYQKALDSIIYSVWDTISIDEYFDSSSKTPYFKRMENLNNLIDESSSSMVLIIENKLVSSYEEAMLHFQDALKRNEEGTIVKSYDGQWKNGKPNTQIKLKKEINLDLKVTGFNYGTGKNEKLISSVNVESSDGLLKTSPTGMKEDVMEFVTKNQENLINTILEIKCSGISYDSDKNYSVLHPVFKGFRDDKKEANSLNECIEIDKSSTFL